MASLGININIEEFIKDIENRPSIWNRNYTYNKAVSDTAWEQLSSLHNFPIPTLKAKWKALRDSFRVEYKRLPRDESGDLLLDPSEFPSKWQHYRSLLYLADHMRSRTTKMDTMDPEEDQYYFEVNTNNSISKLEYDNNFEYYDENLDPSLPPDINIRNLNQANIQSVLPLSANEITPNISMSEEMNETVHGFGPSIGDLESDDISSNDVCDTVNRKFDDDYHFLMSLRPYMFQLNYAQKLRIRMKLMKIIFRELYQDEGELDDK